MPIAHALLVAAMAAAATSDRVPLDLLVQQMVAQVQSFPLIAIPFFMLTGSLMMGGRLGAALVGVLSTLIGRFHGGPAQVGVLSSTLFGGVSGSAVADASAIGSLLIPWHKRLGYPPAFSAATLARGRHHRHPDPAIDPDDPVRADGQCFHCGTVCRGHPARHADVRRLHVHVLVVGKRRNFPRDLTPINWGEFRVHLLYSSPRAAAAGADRAVPALWHRHTHRGGSAVHAVRCSSVGGGVPRPVTWAPEHAGGVGLATGWCCW